MRRHEALVAFSTTWDIHVQGLRRRKLPLSAEHNNTVLLPYLSHLASSGGYLTAVGDQGVGDVMATIKRKIPYAGGV